MDGSVIYWGSHDFDVNVVPTSARSDVMAVAAGHSHVIALRRDGTVVSWGAINGGIFSSGGYTIEVSVPVSAQSGIVSIAAGNQHTLALKNDGRVIAWGVNFNGQTTVPEIAMTGVVAIAAGLWHSVALKLDGNVVAWGFNSDGQTNVPLAARSGVVAIAAGGSHTAALKKDGSVVAWGYNAFGQTTVPAAAGSGVVAIAAGGEHTVALKNDGSVVAWGANYDGQTTVPIGLHKVKAIAAGGNHTVALIEGAGKIEATGDFGQLQLGTVNDQQISLSNTGNLPLVIDRLAIEGLDYDQFHLLGTAPGTLAINASLPVTFRFTPTRLGAAKAALKIYSNDPDSPFVLPIKGTGNFELTATKPTASGSKFTYAPLRLDRSTGLMLQKITFSNTSGVLLNGLRLVLSKVASGVQVYSSSAGKTPGTLEVIYSNAIKANETISFDLVYFDPKRRTAESVNPVIKAEALMEPEPDSLPVAGPEVALRSVRATLQGPWLEWNSVPKANYVVEYSDDAGKTWFSAVHRLSTSGTRMFWIDRGQPETKTVPVGVPNKAGGRVYRVKKL